MKEKIYCVHCGAENQASDVTCVECKKKLNPKNHLLKDYLVDHIKDDIKCNVEDTILGLIEKWIISHLYGVCVVAAVVFTSSVILTREISLHNMNVDYKQTDKPFHLTIKCEHLDLVEKEKFCEEGYTLQDEKCIKISYLEPDENVGCYDGYHMIGDTCISDNNINMDQQITCTTSLPSGGRMNDPSKVMYAYESGGNCYIKYCLDIGYPTSWVPGTICPNEVDISTTPIITYTCNGYQDSNGNCKSYGSKKYDFSCSHGTYNGDKCVLTDTKDNQTECPAGYYYNKDCGACQKEDA